MHEFVPLKNVLIDQECKMKLKTEDSKNLKTSRDYHALTSRQKHLYEMMVANANNIMAVIDAEGIIQFMNPAAERLIGYTPEEMVGEEIFEFLHPADFESFEEVLDLCVDSPGARLPAIEVRLQHKSGAWKWVRLHSKDLQFDEIIAGLFVDIRDITDYKNSNKERLTNSEDS